MSENRRIKRYLLNRARKGKLRKGESEQIYLDNKGVEYPYKWLAQVSSFWNLFMGCLKNGFPIAVPRLWYMAWAFYPFFFIRKDLKVKDPITILNHERIHIRQQRDIHLTISLPLVILSGFAEWFGGFNPFLLLCSVPFIPNVLYGFEMFRSLWNLLHRGVPHITFSMVRENTCFEREAISHAPNAEYLFTRKFWDVKLYM